MTMLQNHMFFPLARRNIVVLALLASVGTACIDARSGSLHDAAADTDPAPDAVAPADTITTPDTITSPDTSPDATERPDIQPDIQPDIASDTAPVFIELPCDCVENEVYRHDACVPTLELGCGPACTTCAEGFTCTNTCAEGFTCIDCAASSSCASRDCRPACGVAYAPHAPVPGPLRLVPASIAPGAAFAIQGTSFYIGALGHNVRIDGKLLQTGLQWNSNCELGVTPPALEPGLHRVEVSQYAGGDPWIDAGFLHVDMPPSCVQPGFACAADGTPCCSDATSRWSCRDGRCRQP